MVLLRPFWQQTASTTRTVHDVPVVVINTPQTVARLRSGRVHPGTVADGSAAERVLLQRLSSRRHNWRRTGAAPDHRQVVDWWRRRQRRHRQSSCNNRHVQSRDDTAE